jgi:hypothetical protein
LRRRNRALPHALKPWLSGRSPENFIAALRLHCLFIFLSGEKRFPLKRRRKSEQQWSWD